MCAFLQSKRCNILERNYFTRYGELDIIAESGGCILFVEVKTRQMGAAMEAKLSVTPSKQKKLVKTAMVYLMEHKTELQPRFDVAEVYHEDGMFGIHYMKHAFTLEGLL